MTTRIGGFRRKTRSKLKKDRNEKGKISLRNFLQKLNTGDKVLLNAEPAYQDGMYFPRYHGKVGTVKSKKGDCYDVTIDDRGKEKILIIHPVHLRKLE
ncbi:MAG: 50S ribosomal protein L21e [Candidatus Woesearchaeota archaeon]